MYLISQGSIGQGLSRVLHKLDQSLFHQSGLQGFIEPLIQACRPGWQFNGFRTHIVSICQNDAFTHTYTLRPSKSWPGFEAGQFVELSVEVDGARISRMFSISSSPERFRKEGVIDLVIRQVPGGKLTGVLSNVVGSGSWVSISHAMGEFTLTSDVRPILMIAAGSGITPIHSMLQSLHFRGNRRTVLLMYYGRQDQWLLKDSLDALAIADPNFTVHYLDTEKDGYCCHRQLVKTCPDALDHQVYVCGPPSLMNDALTLLSNVGIPSTRLHHESFQPVMPSHQQEGAAATVSFVRSGKTVAVEGSSTESMLTLAEGEGLRPTAGCRMGICHQCSCQKQRGVVRNLRTGQLSDAGAGKVQLCISQPVGDVVLDL